MDKCLVLGASGQLGREVVRSFNEVSRVTAVGHRTSERDVRREDIRDTARLEALLREIRPHVVVLTAAYKNPDFCEEHPAEAKRLNVEPIRVLCQALPASAWIIFASSDYVFDGTKPPYQETDPVSPVNEYGRNKCDAEALLRDRPRSISVRMPVLCGIGSDAARPYGFISELMTALETKAPTVLDDVLVRWPTWTRDVAAAMRFLWEKDASGIYHISGPRKGTRYGWTVELGKLMGLPTDHLKPSGEVISRRASRPTDATLSTDKLRGLGYSQFTDFRDVVRAVQPALPG